MWLIFICCAFNIGWSKKLEFPLKDCKNQKILSISQQPIEILKARSFQECVNLENLKINHNNLSMIERHTFQGLKNLRTLEIQGQYLKDLNGSLENLDNLEWIDLSKNRLEKIDSTTFYKTYKLREIILIANKISVIGFGTFDQLNKLEVLKLCKNQLSEFPAVRANYIDISLNEIVRLEVSETTQEMDVSKNVLEQIDCPDRINMVVLDMSCNFLSNWLCIQKMEKLRILIVDDNKFQDFPKTYKFKNLTLISLRNNQVQWNPKEICGLDNLTHLAVNRFDSYHNMKKHFPKLAILKLDVRSWSCSDMQVVYCVLRKQSIQLNLNIDELPENKIHCQKYPNYIKNINQIEQEDSRFFEIKYDDFMYLGL